MLYLHGMGHFFPKNIITNRFISELDIGSDEQWILERVGISARRTSLDLDYIKTTKNKDPRGATEASIITRPTSAAAAAKMALSRAGIKPDDIGMVISGTSTPEYTIPAEAALIAAEIGIEVPCLDINAACSTFVIQLSFLASMDPALMPAYILLVNPENYTHVIDYSDRRVAPLFGDGYSAAVISGRVPTPKKFEAFAHGSNPASWHRVKIPKSGHFYQDGSYVQRFAIQRATKSLQHLRNQYPINGNRFKFVGHQANLMMLNHVCKRCDIPETSHWHHVVDYGNTGCSGAASVLSKNWNQLSENDHIALAVVGSGLTWAHAMLIAQ